MKKPNKALIIMMCGVVCAALLFSSCEKKPQEPLILNYPLTAEELAAPVLMINGDPVTMETYRYHFLNLKNSYDQGDEAYWTNTPSNVETLKEDTLTAIKQNIAVAQLFEDYGLSLTDVEIKAIGKQIDEEIAKYKDNEYEQILNENFLTDALYRSNVMLSAKQIKLVQDLFSEGGEYYFTDEEFKELAKKEFVHASHVLISIDTENAETLANEVLKKAQEGEDFDQLVEEYGEDPGMENNPEGYYFTKGEMVPEFENAAFALEENQISDIVKTDFGYHIIKRLPISDSYIDENITTLKNQYMNLVFNTLIDNTIANYQVDFTELYEI